MVQVRAGFGIAEGDRVCMFMFGAHALTLEPQEDWLPSGWVCVVCSGGKPLSAPPNPHHLLKLTPHRRSHCECHAISVL